jgi:hypothetical protein
LILIKACPLIDLPESSYTRSAHLRKSIEKGERNYRPTDAPVTCDYYTASCMRIYYSKRINFIEPDDDVPVTEDMKCWHIVRIVETDVDRYEDEDFELWFSEKYHSLTKQEADEKIALLNESIDNSKPALTAMEQLKQDYERHELLKLEIQRLQKRLEQLEIWIRFKEIKYLPAPPNVKPAD